MPHNLGVGRGNGLGSRRSQFKSGQPSANPRGRPKKVRLDHASSAIEVLQQLFSETVVVEVGPMQTRRMRRLDAVVRQMVVQLGTAPFREKVAFFQKIGGFDYVLAPPEKVGEDTIAAVVAELAAFAESEGGVIP